MKGFLRFGRIGFAAQKGTYPTAIPTARRRLATLLTTTTIAAFSSGCGSSAEDGGTPGRAHSGAPSISGIPKETVIVGESFEFRPEASDPNGDSLAFSIFNQPSWTSFDGGTGELAGVPEAGHEGVYDDVRITVSDGANTAAISFSLIVSTQGDASVTLSWTPPTVNEDGTALTDLAGYYIYYGNEEGDYPNRVDIATPGISTYVIEGLTADTYYLVATAYNSSGIESLQSSAVAKVAH
jgi:hypothetical protein